VVVEEPVSVESDYAYTIPIINLNNYVNSLNSVNSNGATYSISLCVDVPVNSAPDAMVIYSGGMGIGHCFLIATKTNGANSVTEVFGFYPNQVPSLTDPAAPVPSAVKDNGGEEINASITISPTAAQFTNFLNTALTLSKSQYSLVNFNCSNFAVQAFNAATGTSLPVVPFVFVMPGITVGSGYITPATELRVPDTPQGVFAGLQSLKLQGGAQAAGINFDLSGNTKAPKSYGPDN
jgi:hypothetical protein